MEKIEMRARARAAARAAGLFELDLGEEARVRAPKRGNENALPPPIDPIDEAQARAACAPMGRLEFIVQAAGADGRVRSLYVIVPDLALKPHYARLGLCVEPGCHVLLDAAALAPVAVLRFSEAASERTPAPSPASAGFNPYFDVPPA